MSAADVEQQLLEGAGEGNGAPMHPGFVVESNTSWADAVEEDEKAGGDPTLTPPLPPVDLPQKRYGMPGPSTDGRCPPSQRPHSVEPVACGAWGGGDFCGLPAMSFATAKGAYDMSPKSFPL